MVTVGPLSLLQQMSSLLLTSFWIPGCRSEVLQQLCGCGDRVPPCQRNMTPAGHFLYLLVETGFRIGYPLPNELQLLVRRSFVPNCWSEPTCRQLDHIFKLDTVQKSVKLCKGKPTSKIFRGHKYLFWAAGFGTHAGLTVGQRSSRTRRPSQQELLVQSHLQLQHEVSSGNALERLSGVCHLQSRHLIQRFYLQAISLVSEL